MMKGIASTLVPTKRLGLSVVLSAITSCFTAMEMSFRVTVTLDTKFEISTMAIGAYYYTDRDYMITGGVPDWMLGRIFDSVAQ